MLSEKEKLEELLLGFICRTGAYPFYDDMPYDCYLERLAEHANVLKVSIPSDEKKLGFFVYKLLFDMQHRELIQINDYNGFTAKRDCVDLSFTEFEIMKEVIQEMIEDERNFCGWKCK